MVKMVNKIQKILSELRTTLHAVISLEKYLDSDWFVSGMRFGLMQVKTGLSHILSRYEVTPCKDTPVPLVFDDNSVLLHTKTEVILSFKKMSK